MSNPTTETPFAEPKDGRFEGPSAASIALEDTAPQNPEKHSEGQGYMHGPKLVLVFLSFCLSILVVALDTNIVATALPRIVSDFNALQDITWVPTAYLLTQGSLILCAGKLLTIIPAKTVMLVAVGLFELGSLISGVAPNIHALIVGRAISGCGAAGIISSILVSIAQIASLETRPACFGIIGAVFGLSSILGPLIGGALTQRVTWRWCFYINLPVGGFALATLIFLLETRPPIGQASPHEKSTFQRIVRMDWIGAILCLGTVVCLILALQMGGNVKPWSAPSIIALFCVFGVLLISLVLWERHMEEDRALLSHAALKRRTEIGASLEGLFLQVGLYIGAYYIPLWYQAARQRSPLQSGIDTLPFMLSVVVSALVSGALASSIGRYWPFMFGTPAIAAIGAGLLFTADIDTSTAKMIGYQILFGMGIGGCMQDTDIAVQADFADDEKLIPQAATIVSFSELMGATVGLAIAGSTFSNILHRKLSSSGVLTPAEIAAVEASVTAIAILPASLQTAITKIYVQTISPAFIIVVPAMGLAMLSSLLVKNHNLKTRGLTPPSDIKNADNAEEDLEKMEEKDASTATTPS